MDPCCTTQVSKTQPLSTAQKGLSSAENSGKLSARCGNCRKLILISWTSDTVKEEVRKGAVRNMAAHFLATPPLHYTLRLGPILQLGIFGLTLSHQPKFGTKHLLAKLSWSFCAKPCHGKTTLQTISARTPLLKGEAFLLTVGAFLLTVKLLCLQSLKALTRSTSHCKQRSNCK